MERQFPFTDFSFEISGSKTGKDRVGRASENFVSKSKRVIIKKGDAETGGDWHLNRFYKVLKTIVKTDDMVKWKTYSISTDLYTLKRNLDTCAENITTLFQGIPYKDHTLTITGTARVFSLKR